MNKSEKKAEERKYISRLFSFSRSAQRRWSGTERERERGYGAVIQIRCRSSSVHRDTLSRTEANGSTMAYSTATGTLVVTDIDSVSSHRMLLIDCRRCPTCSTNTSRRHLSRLVNWTNEDKPMCLSILLLENDRLIHACCRNDLEGVQWLLENTELDAIDLKSGINRSALHEAVLHRKGQALARLLCQYGADPKQRDSLG